MDRGRSRDRQFTTWTINFFDIYIFTPPVHEMENIIHEVDKLSPDIRMMHGLTMYRSIYPLLY